MTNNENHGLRAGHVCVSNKISAERTRFRALTAVRYVGASGTLSSLWIPDLPPSRFLPTVVAVAVDFRRKLGRFPVNEENERLKQRIEISIRGFQVFIFVKLVLKY